MMPVYSAYEFAVIARNALVRLAEKRDEIDLTDLSGVADNPSSSHFVALMNGRRYRVIVEELGPPEG